MPGTNRQKKALTYEDPYTFGFQVTFLTRLNEKHCLACQIYTTGCKVVIYTFIFLKLTETVFDFSEDPAKYVLNKRGNITFSLEIKKVDFQDTGAYMCKVTQKALSHYTNNTIKLFVHRK